ncbi:MAG TPA: cupin domain-containing protein [Bdellovibrionota bacterium]|jgi:uncharacterized protein YjlB|nr:cupin domain-containing protein [Bdellovibrionota bacterium]
MSFSPAQLFFFRDDGIIPNSPLPLLLYRDAFAERDEDGARWLEATFAAHRWLGSWRNGVYEFHHYHSTSHEVLGVYAGTALLKLGGEGGQELRVAAGDVIVIPAGVGHKRLDASEDFAVVGAYPEGRDYDTLRGRAGDRPRADRNIAQVPLPRQDPLLGDGGGLLEHWTRVRTL